MFWKTFTIIAAVIMCASSSVRAASSVVINSQNAISYATADTEENSAAAALEQCGGTEAGCTLLLSCAKAGFGAYAAGPGASGVACGFTSARDAQIEALRHCRNRLPGKGCKVVTTWVD